MKSLYEIKHFKTSNDDDLTKALKLYSEHTEPAYRTDTREILYWLDKFHKKSDDSFYIFGFYLNSTLIGFAEAAYFLQERMLILDYLVIEKEFLGNNTFYEFLEKLRSYLSEQAVLIDYITVEVGYFNEETEPPDSSKQWVRLLKMSHFGVVKCSYYIPRLGVNNFESEMKGIMMLYSKNEDKQIRKETYFQIVNAIYFKYYQRWYTAFMRDEAIVSYSKTLYKLLALMEKELAKKTFIEVNGFQNIFPINSDSKKTLKASKLIKIIIIITSFIICSILIGAAHLYIKSKFGIDASALVNILTIAAFLVLFIGALLFERKSNIFSRLIEKIIGRF